MLTASTAYKVKFPSIRQQSVQFENLTLHKLFKTSGVKYLTWSEGHCGTITKVAEPSQRLSEDSRCHGWLKPYDSNVIADNIVSLFHSIAEENCCDSLGQWMDSRSVWDWALSCHSEAEQPDQPKGKRSRFNLTDPQEEGEITSINSREMGKDNSLFDLYRVRAQAEN